MKLSKPLFILMLVFLGSNHLYCQIDTLNQIDSLGMKQGYWIVYGKDKPDRGIPDKGKIEEGRYLNDRKEGFWIKYHVDGITPRLKSNYRNGRPTGYYRRIRESGFLIEEGVFVAKGGNHITKRYDECGRLISKKQWNSNGREDGTIVYYYSSCDSADTTIHIEMEMTKVDGVTVGTARIYFYSGCIKQLIEYANDGTIISKAYYIDDCDLNSTEYGTINKNR